MALESKRMPPATLDEATRGQNIEQSAGPIAQHDYTAHADRSSTAPCDETLLAPRHLAMLRDASGIADVVIAERGYQTIEGAGGLCRAEAVRVQQTRRPNRPPACSCPSASTDGQQALIGLSARHASL